MSFESHWPFLLWAYNKRRMMGIEVDRPDGWHLIAVNHARHCRIGRITLKEAK